MSTARVVAEAAPVEIEARELAHHYGRQRGLDPVSFALHAPGVATVSGANGSGKSTLLRILAGLLPQSAGAIECRYRGVAWDRDARRGAVGFAAPELQFYDELSVEENLRFAAEARGLRSAPTAVRAALERVGLERRAHTRVAALSSGLRQRVRLAFAVLDDPPLLLLDEPGSHLDDEGRVAVRTVVREAAGRGLVVIATNDPSERELGEQRIELRGRGLGDRS